MFHRNCVFVHTRTRNKFLEIESSPKMYVTTKCVSLSRRLYLELHYNAFLHSFGVLQNLVTCAGLERQNKQCE